MKASEQTIKQVERAICKVADKFPSNVEATLLTDIHLRANQETGELVAFDDDDNEITRAVIEQWIGNTDEKFYENITSVIRKCIEHKRNIVEEMSIIKPFSFVLEDDEKSDVAELFVVDGCPVDPGTEKLFSAFLYGDTVIFDPELMADLDQDLNDFLDKLLKD